MTLQERRIKKDIKELYNQGYKVDILNLYQIELYLPKIDRTIQITYSKDYPFKPPKVYINNISYSNAVKVKTEIKNASLKVFITPTISIPLTLTVAQNTYNYYAPKYGMIKGHNQLKISVQGQGTIIDNNSTTTLLSANIIK